MELANNSVRTIRQYEIREKLGEGAGGTVYRAFDTHLQRQVVVKLLHKSGAASRHMVPLLEEARLASAIDHPNVCTVYEADELDGRPYLVMQYVPGRTLDEFLKDGPLAQSFAVSIGIQVASGLDAAHRHGILHRDLKPANIMITDEGLAKILDFGLARRTSIAPDSNAGEAASDLASRETTHFGTTAYMAPEQFATRRSTVQSDLWSLGVILFQMAVGRHPFWTPSGDPAELSHAIQSRPVPSLTAGNPDIDPAFAEVIMKALARQTDDRYRHASEVREALKTVMRTLDPESHTTPGEAVVPAPLAEAESHRGGIFSSLAERFLTSRPSALPKNAVAVLPFQDHGTEQSPPFYGLALADAISSRLSQVPALLVRPPRMIRSSRKMAADPIDAGRQLNAAYVLSGHFARTPAGFHLTWKLLSVEADEVVTGQNAEIASPDLVMVQHQLADDVFEALQASGELQISTTPTLRPAAAVGEAAISSEVAEDYLAARALLNSHATRSSHERDLEQACATFERVIEEAPDFAPAHASLGIALTRYVRFGFGGVNQLIAAQRNLDEALRLDSSNIEAKLYRAYTLLWRGEKEQARRDVQYLLTTAAYDAEVFIGAGVILHLDGLLDEALHTLGTALRINPTLGPRVYNLRARIYIYQRRPELAMREIQKGLSLEPHHTLLRTTHGVWHLRHGDLDEAVSLLEGVVADDPHLRLAHPTMAIAYHMAGQPERAAALMTDETLAVATADCEMSYRIATYYAVAGNAEEALHWLRKSIYLGNHNAPWFEANPHWEAVRDHEDIRQALDELSGTQRLHRERWKRVLSEIAG